jgi:hypothetical protein
MGLKCLRTKSSAAPRSDVTTNPFQDGRQQDAIRTILNIMPYGAHYEEDMSRLYIHSPTALDDDTAEETGDPEGLDEVTDEQIHPPIVAASLFPTTQSLWICAFVILFVVYCVDFVAFLMVVSVMVLVLGILAKFGVLVHGGVVSSSASGSIPHG